MRPRSAHVASRATVPGSLAAADATRHNGEDAADMTTGQVLGTHAANDFLLMQMEGYGRVMAALRALREAGTQSPDAVMQHIRELPPALASLQAYAAAAAAQDTLALHQAGGMSRRPSHNDWLRSRHRCDTNWG